MFAGSNDVVNCIFWAFWFFHEFGKMMKHCTWTLVFHFSRFCSIFHVCMRLGTVTLSGPISLFHLHGLYAAFHLAFHIFTSLPLRSNYSIKSWLFHIFSNNYFILIHQFTKFITHPCLIRFPWDFLHLIHHDLYLIVIFFPDFFDEWILFGIRVCDMYPYFVPFTKSIVKWWYFIQWPWNFLCLN